VNLGPDGFRIQRRLLELRGALRNRLDDAATLRQQGVNLIVCPVTPETTSVWADADTWGFFVLGELSAASLPLVSQLESHPSHLGWICAPGATPPAGLVGVRMSTEAIVPPWARFAVGDSSAPSIPSIPLVRTSTDL